MKAKMVFEFHKGTDPKRALGLGGYTWDTLKFGTILKSPDHININIDGKFVSRSSAIGIWPEMYLLLMNVEYKREDYIEAEFTFFWDYDSAIKAKNFGYNSERNYNIMQGSINQFKNRFIILPANFKENLT